MAFREQLLVCLYCILTNAILLHLLKMPLNHTSGIIFHNNFFTSWFQKVNWLWYGPWSFWSSYCLTYTWYTFSQVAYYDKMIKSFNYYPIKIGRQGSFLHVALRWKFQSQGCQRFLQNEDILPYEKNIAIWIFRLPYFCIVKFHKKWPLKSAIWSYKINITCF